MNNLEIAIAVVAAFGLYLFLVARAGRFLKETSEDTDRIVAEYIAEQRQKKRRKYVRVRRHKP